MSRRPLSCRTREDLLGWPPTVDVVTAGRPFGIGESKARELARAGTFPVRILRIGKRYRVVTAEILEVLGLGTESPQPALDRTA